MESATGADSHLLLAVLLAHWGFERTLEWARGLVVNLAREFQRDARGRLRALAAGICDVTVAGVQDLARLSRSELPEDQIAARRIGLRWPDQDGWGAVVTIGGAGVTRLTREPDAARQLLEFLTDGDAQRLLAGRLDDYPVAPGIPVAGALVEWGAFQADPTGLTALDQQADAVARIIALSGWK